MHSGFLNRTLPDIGWYYYYPYHRDKKQNLGKSKTQLKWAWI